MGGRRPARERTAVVIIHGMGEQKPRETVNGFVRTGLWPIADSPRDEPRRVYYSRPTVLTDSYEARVLLAIEREHGHLKSQRHTDFYEYHWSYLMTGNAIGDLVPLVRRLLLRLPWHMPGPLRVLWTTLWLALIGLVVYAWQSAPDGLLSEPSIDTLVDTLFPHGLLAALAGLAILAVTAWLTSSFVDVARYLDTSPRSYDVRRAIRGGLVDLLQTIQDSGRYARVVVVAHSLGAYIAYDALTSLWTNQTARMGQKFTTLETLETAAKGLQDAGDRQEPLPTQLGQWRKAQFALWKEGRDKGLPWLVTDFISVGTPMYMADMLLTSNRRRFAELCARSELPQCPPLSDTQSVEGTAPVELSYGWRGQPRLVTGSPFAVVRWTNLWFPSVWWFFGDWFGGPLRPLFGAGITDIRVTGNLAGRLLPAVAHTRYFSYPDDTGSDDIAKHLRDALALDTRIGD